MWSGSSIDANVTAFLIYLQSLLKLSVINNFSPNIKSLIISFIMLSIEKWSQEFF